jgi:hypothetical protein
VKDRANISGRELDPQRSNEELNVPNRTEVDFLIVKKRKLLWFTETKLMIGDPLGIIPR